jgi:hypothetical protein
VESAPGFVNCPDAYIQLPSDIGSANRPKRRALFRLKFQSKIRQSFLLGVVHDTTGKKIFIETFKIEIYGFHHIPGRYLWSNVKKKNEESK